MTVESNRILKIKLLPPHKDGKRTPQQYWKNGLFIFESTGNEFQRRWTDATKKPMEIGHSAQKKGFAAKSPA